jgi:osmotically-inducible protein OsmY
MRRAGHVPDKQISRKVEQRLSRAGLGSQSRIAVRVRSGEVMLSGTLQYETQRRPVLHAARGAEGVRRIVDHLQVRATARKCL